MVADACVLHDEPTVPDGRAVPDEPAVPDEHAPPLTGRRAAVLSALRASSSLTVADLARRLDVHPNTVRLHLDALERAGAVERVTSSAPGPTPAGTSTGAGRRSVARGRPALRYRARAAARTTTRGTLSSYRLLAEALTVALAGDPDATPRALAAGRSAGRGLPAPPAQTATATSLTAEAATAHLTLVLDELGFAPEPTELPEVVPDPAPARPAARGSSDHDAGGRAAQDPMLNPMPSLTPDRAESLLHLRRCPFGDLARRHRDVVCAAHLGMLQGALAAWDAPVAATALDPLVAPDLCVAHLHRRSPATSRTMSSPTPVRGPVRGPARETEETR